MISLAAVVLASEGAEHELNPIWFPAPLFGLIMLVLLSALVFVTLSFRDVANRHSDKAEAYAKDNEENAHH